MKFLDEDLVFTLGNRSEGYHNYQVIIQPNNEDDEPKIIYNGRFYIAPGNNIVDIDITDILANYRYIYKIPTDFSSNTYSTAPKSVNNVGGDKLIATVTVKDITQPDGRGDLVGEQIVFVYRYPNANYTDIYDAWSSPIYSGKCPMITMLQSSELYNTFKDSNNIEHVYFSPKYLPHYPIKKTDNYGMTISLLFDENSSDLIYFILPDNTEGDSNVLWVYDNADNIRGSWDFRYSLKDWFYKYRNSTDDEIKSSITDTTLYYADIKTHISRYGLIVSYSFYADVTNQERANFLSAVRNFFGEDCADAIEGTIFNGQLTGTLQLPIGATSTQSLYERWLVFEGEYIPMRHTDPDKPIMTFGTVLPYEMENRDIYPRKTPIAKFDKCPSEYYLMWLDRMGGIQSQPLRNKSVYSESFNPTTMTSYQNHKRVINAEIQPEWELMTEWISDEFYPIWESIFSSPYLLLYNTKLDRNYRVIAIDKEFIQKTHKNQKNLFKLTIKLQLDKPQNIIS